MPNSIGLFANPRARVALGCALAAALAVPARAMHPLVTDDAGTVGRRNAQVELNAEREHDRRNGADADSLTLAGQFGFGLADSLDLIVGLPYQELRADGAEPARGLSDASIELKWRFARAAGFELALKPGLTLASGDHDRGLSPGRPTQSAAFIASRALGRGSLHLNAGYSRNSNLHGERLDLWDLSAAAELPASEALRLVCNVGLARSPDPADGTRPAFALTGFIYALGRGIELDFGLKAGLSETEPDWTVLTGTTFSF